MLSWIKSVVGNDAYTFERGLAVVFVVAGSVIVIGLIGLALWVTCTGG